MWASAIGHPSRKNNFASRKKLESRQVARRCGRCDHQLTTNPVSNNVGGVKQFSRTLLYALREERHSALVIGLRISNLGLASNRWGQDSVRPSQSLAICSKLFHVLEHGTTTGQKTNKAMHTARLATLTIRGTCRKELRRVLVAGGGFEPPTFGL